PSRADWTRTPGRPPRRSCRRTSGRPWRGRRPRERARRRGRRGRGCWTRSWPVQPIRSALVTDPGRPGHGPRTTGSRTSDDRVTDLGRPGHGPRTIVTVEPRGASPPPGDWNRTILPPKPVTLTSKPDSRRARSASRRVRPTTFGTGTFVSLPSSQPIWIGPASTRQSRLLTTIVTPSPRETPVPPAGACSITEFGSLPSTFFLRTVTL